MKLLRIPRLYAFTGLLALFAFGGDIVADAMADARGEHCVSESSSPGPQHEKTPCSHCSCSIHNGAVVDSISIVAILGADGSSSLVPAADKSAPRPLPAAIDHPPQLG